MDVLSALASWLRGMLAAALLAVACVAGAQESQATPEHRVKAAFVYKFCDYVQWPAGAFADDGAPLVIGVLGSTAMADELARLTAGRSVGTRPVQVRRLAKGDAWSGLHVVFVGAGAEAQLPTKAGAPVLLVSEAADRQPPGAMVNFVVVADKVRFDVTLPTAEAAGLKISSRLLGVARRVETGR